MKLGDVFNLIISIEGSKRVQIKQKEIEALKS
jgi:hypothetical protein